MAAFADILCSPSFRAVGIPLRNREAERRREQKKSILARFGLPEDTIDLEALWDMIFQLDESARNNEAMLAEIKAEFEMAEDGEITKGKRFTNFLKKIFLHKTSERTSRILDGSESEVPPEGDPGDSDTSMEGSVLNPHAQESASEETGKGNTVLPADQSGEEETTDTSGVPGTKGQKKTWSRRPHGCGKVRMKPDQHRRVLCYPEGTSETNPPLDKNGNPMIRRERYVRTEYTVETHLIANDIYQVEYISAEAGERKEEQQKWTYPSWLLPLLRRSMCSPSILATSLYEKLMLGVPNYRQESEWERIGFPIERGHLSYWEIKVYLDKHIQTIMNRLRECLLSEEYLHADETVLQVMKEPGRENTTNSYIWIYCTAEAARRRIVIFDYQPGRKGEFAEKALEGFTGYLITDVYGGYNGLKWIIRCLCWCHLRRKIIEAMPADKKRAAKSKGAAALKLINRIFKLEQEFKSLNAEERLEARKQQVQPILDELRAWAEKTQPLLSKKSALYDAIRYMLDHWQGFTEFMKNGNVPIHNQTAEQMAKFLAVSRKNWLFYGSPRGASAGMAYASLLKTAELNDLDPLKYLEMLFNEMRGDSDHPKWQDPDYIDSLLPWSEKARETCRCQGA